MDFAIFGAGCFWCVEAIFSQLIGVTDVTAGYTGGDVNNPNYKQVSSGNSGHAEVCKIMFNPNLISYEELLKVFWETHDPTTLNKQGDDIGSQYRSAIFYKDKEQEEIATAYKNQLSKENIFDGLIVTAIVKLGKYYKAENYHQNYYQNNKNQPYCKYIIKPKIDKFNKTYQK